MVVRLTETWNSGLWKGNAKSCKCKSDVQKFILDVFTISYDSTGLKGNMWEKWKI